MISRVVLGAASVLAFYTLCARAEPLEFPVAAPPCLPKKGLSVLDFSMPVPPLRTENNDPVLLTLKREFKVDTIFRYYDHPDETIPRKTLHSVESDALIGAGFKLGVVFQHHNDNPAKF